MIGRVVAFEDDEPPYVEIEQRGRLTWWIYVCHGVMIYGPDGGPFRHLGSEAGARRRAKRLLAAYVRREGLRATRHRLDLPNADEYRRAGELRAETSRALAELRDPWMYDDELAHGGLPAPLFAGRHDSLCRWPRRPCVCIATRSITQP